MGELQSGEYQYPSEFREALVERDKKIVLDEGKLADIFIRATNMRRWHGQMYNDEGPISDEDLKETLVHLLITEYNRFKRIYAEADSIAKTIYYLMPTEEIMIIFDPDERAPRPRTWEAYRRFCHENGSKVMGQQSFYRRLNAECKRRGGDLRRLDSGTWTFLGMKLREVDSGIKIKGVTR